MMSTSLSKLMNLILNYNNFLSLNMDREIHKIIVLGKSGAGKSALLNKLTGNDFFRASHYLSAGTT